MPGQTDQVCESQISRVEGELKAQYTLLVKLLEKEFIFMPGQTDQVSVILRCPE